MHTRFLKAELPMIPLQLKIRNFLSYGSQGEIIDFEPYHLICLTGKNGHGKSALLDAITWALWGQARKVAGVTRGDEHLVRLGESGMAVTLDFSCGGQRYRVTRDFSMALNKKGISQLHLGLFKDDIDAYVSLSEKNLRDTPRKARCYCRARLRYVYQFCFFTAGASERIFKKITARTQRDLMRAARTYPLRRAAKTRPRAPTDL